ncbi:MAG TPA: MerC domain-containing protein [Sphingomonas sp.]
MTTSTPKPAGHIDWIERAAVGASILCLIHCLALPILLAALPALSTILSVPESIHVWILAFAIPAAGAALVTGYRRHMARYPMVMGVIGLTFMAIGAFVFAQQWLETPITVFGSITLASAHVINWRLRHRGHAH